MPDKSNKPAKQDKAKDSEKNKPAKIVNKPPGGFVSPRTDKGGSNH
jgi:hypothetical protein